MSALELYTSSDSLPKTNLKPGEISMGVSRGIFKIKDKKPQVI